MALNRVKAFTLKNGEFQVDASAQQSGFSGGTPASITSLSTVGRAYSETGYIGIFANGSDVVNSGDNVTFYSGPGIFSMEKGANEAAFPYDETQTYVAGNNFGIVSGVWSNSAPSVVRGRVLAVGAVSGGKTQGLTLLFV